MIQYNGIFLFYVHWCQCQGGMSSIMIFKIQVHWFYESMVFSSECTLFTSFWQLLHCWSLAEVPVGYVDIRISEKLSANGSCMNQPGQRTICFPRDSRIGMTSSMKWVSLVTMGMQSWWTPLCCSAWCHAPSRSSLQFGDGMVEEDLKMLVMETVRLCVACPAYVNVCHGHGPNSRVKLYVICCWLDLYTTCTCSTWSLIHSLIAFPSKHNIISKLVQLSSYWWSDYNKTLEIRNSEITKTQWSNLRIMNLRTITMTFDPMICYNVMSHESWVFVSLLTSLLDWCYQSINRFNGSTVQPLFVKCCLNNWTIELHSYRM